MTKKRAAIATAASVNSLIPARFLDPDPDLFVAQYLAFDPSKVVEITPGFESFVGLHSVPVRHGMTIGELSRLAHPSTDIEAEGRERTQLDDDRLLDRRGRLPEAIDHMAKMANTTVAAT